ncbi:MAG: hypothetical protein A2Z16_07975 [Chloroflexi bacterium RBG_16_54_18]|nr:MAG: hypothetical protein A2Z16_07975 [Chloroflexi bacterium RBG_16_54_18]
MLMLDAIIQTVTKPFIDCMFSFSIPNLDQKVMNGRKFWYITKFEPFHHPFAGADFGREKPLIIALPI